MSVSLKLALHRSLAACTCLGALVVGQSPTSRPNKRQVEELIADYLDMTTSAEERGEICARLKLSSPALANSPLRAALRDEATRARALELAVNLQVQGLWSTAKAYIDGPDEDVIIKYGLALSERGADLVTLQRWVSSEWASTPYSIATGALRSWPVSIDVIRDLKKHASAADDERKTQDAATILCFQLGVPKRPADRLDADWTDLVTAYEIDARRFRLRGEDLLRTTGWEQIGPIARIGSNYRLGADSWMTFSPPATWDKRDMTVLVRARPVTGKGTSIGLGTSQGTWEVCHEEGKWSVRNDSQVEYFVDAVLGEWVTIKFEVKDDNEPNSRLARRCSIFVNDKALLRNGSLNGEFRRLAVNTGDSTAVVGSIEVIQQ